MIWYDSAANQSLLFFDFPCSKPHFLATIVPHLQKSLSFPLSHFPPLAGNIIRPLNPADKPVLRYESTDSVSFTVAESAADFSHLTGNHPRNCDEFYSLSPLLPPAVRSETSISCPVLALQATLFPGQGLSIGFITHHAVADASNVVSFIRAWALINKMESDDDHYIGAKLTESNLLPFFDRKKVTNLDGLDSVYWDDIVKSSCSAEPPPPPKLPINKLRATFVMKRDEIEKLKSLVRADHVSSFTVICALVWVCSARSAAAGGGDVAGSPRFDFYAADFGWGKPKKFEALFIDVNDSISLCKSRDFEGGLEFGLSKTAAELDAFTKAFNAVLVDLLQ